MPGKRLPYLALMVCLTAVLVTCLLWVNAQYLFHSNLYEDSDLGADSLSVLRAEHFHELYGQYSRWGFHHPGPAVIYCFAWGEMLFYRWLHLVPTGFNGQLIVSMAMVCSFLAAGIGVAARWVRGPLFVALALLLAALHLTSMGPQTWVLLPWLIYVTPLIFFFLLMTGASVGAGQGEDLPLLALAGGLLVNTHIAQPLFAGPVCLLAYAGLTWSCARPDAARPGASWAAWRVYPREHLLAAALAFVFLLPMAVDLCWGADSNFLAILRHMRAHQGEKHPWLDSLYCFVRFGAYTPSHNFIAACSPGHASWAGIGRYCAQHAQMAALWIGALLSPLFALAARFEFPPRGVTAPTPEETAAPALDGSRRGRGRFLGWLAAMCLLTAGLTLFWGHIEDGDLFYYNSWFTYSIYFGLVMLAAGAVSDLVETLAACGRWPRAVTVPATVCCALAAAGYLASHRERYRAVVYNDDICRAQAQAVFDALAKRPAAPRAKLLLFGPGDWGAATGVATLLTRAGYPSRVPPEWLYMFGREQTLGDPLAKVLAAPGAADAYDLWRIAPPVAVPPDIALRHPMSCVYRLLPGGLPLDPAVPGTAIAFVGEHPNYGDFAVSGWAVADPGADYAWSVGKSAILVFAPKAVPADAVVEIDFGMLFPFPPQSERTRQRLQIHFNGHDLGMLAMTGGTPGPLKALVPAALWNQRDTALLVLGFPDAVSPREIGMSQDARPLAFAADKIAFRLADPAAGAAMGQETNPPPAGTANKAGP